MDKNGQIQAFPASLPSGQLYNYWQSLPAIQHVIWCWPLVIGLGLLSALSIAPAALLALHWGQLASLPYLLLFIPILAFHTSLFLIMRGHRLTLSLGVGLVSLIWAFVAWTNEVPAMHLWLAEYVTLCNLIAFMIVFRDYRSWYPNKPASLIRLYGFCFMWAASAVLIVQALIIFGVTFKSDPLILGSGSLLIEGIFPDHIIVELRSGVLSITALCFTIIVNWLLTKTYRFIWKYANEAIPLMPKDRY